MPSAYLQRVTRPANWQAVKDTFRRFPTGWAFRGQRDASWPLSTSLERAVASSIPVDLAEKTLLRRFEPGAYPYLTPPLIPSERMGWLTLMQHYGAPTRLLDWTLSPYVAAFFALEHYSTDCTVWALGINMLGEASAKLLKGLTSDRLIFDNGADPGYHRLLFKLQPAGVFAVKSFRRAERLQI
jgi:hypothetical protein